MDPGKLFQIFTNSTLLATRLFSGDSLPQLHFIQLLYCISIPEDVQRNSVIGKVKALRKNGEAVRIEYSISNGNEKSLFSINKISGELNVVSSLDYEKKTQHDLTITATSSGEVATATVRVIVEDVNDNMPEFVTFVDRITVIEEDDRDLPKVLTKVRAVDADKSSGGLFYAAEGDGLNETNPLSGTFLMHPFSGELFQIKPVDRDPPNGKAVWKLRIQAFDGQSSPKISPSYLAAIDAKIQYLEGYSSIGKNKIEKRSKLSSKDFVNLLRKKRKSNVAISPMKNLIADIKIFPSLDSHVTNRPHKVAPSVVDLERGLIGWLEFIKYDGIRNGKTTKNLRENIIYTSNKRKLLKEKRILTQIGIKNLLKTLNSSLYTNKYVKHRTFIKLFRENLKRKTLDNKSVYKGPNILKNEYNNLIFSANNKILKKDYSKNRSFEFSRKGIKKNYSKRIFKNPFIIIFNTNFGKDLYKLKLKKKISNENQSKREEKRINLKKLFCHKDSITFINASLLSSDKLKLKNNSKEFTENFRKGKAIISTSASLYDQSLLRKGKRFTKRNAVHQKELICPSISYPIDSNNGNKINAIERPFHILVKDINDNLPKFSQETFSMSIKENGEADELVGKVHATDNDDVTSGTNALLTYSLEKNVVAEHTGERLFKIDPKSGEIRTVLCCLDREVTSFYRLQVVATDGGGLQGTATVMVHLEDENDNPPKFIKKTWETSVEEHFGKENLPNEAILDVTIIDPDVSNFFACRIIQSSGVGWQFFKVVVSDRHCRISASQILDYENEFHRKGFYFKVQVSDMGDKFWSDPRHADTASISIKLVDVNDHAPRFETARTEITLKENIEVGTKVLTVRAIDLDSGKNGNITYSIEDPFEAFRIDRNGTVWIANGLDREGPVGKMGDLRLTASDNGTPPLNGTQIFSVTLLDVNDCAPSIVSAQVFHVQENSPPQRIGTLYALDEDEEKLKHGPPFSFKLNSIKPEELRGNISLKSNPVLDNGRGGGEIWLLSPVDREKNPEIKLSVCVSDVNGLSTNHSIRIVVDDINDNEMHEGNKNICVLKPLSLPRDFFVGRVYVNDSDDWDIPDKVFTWDSRDSHPYFNLQTEDGRIYARNNVPDGRYNLRFKVSDQTWNQKEVKANVSVLISSIMPENFIYAIAIKFFSIKSEKLLEKWSPMGDSNGVLGKFLRSLKQTLISFIEEIQVISIEELDSHLERNEPSCRNPKGSFLEVPSNSSLLGKSTKIWLVASYRNKFVHPVKFKGLIQLNKELIMNKSSVSFALADRIEENSSGQKCLAPDANFPLLAVSSLYGTSFSLNNFQLQVIDMNATAIISPILSQPYFRCSPEANPEPFGNISVSTFSSRPHLLPSSILISSEGFRSPFCTTNFCLNGGRCIPTETASRCICPGGTIGPRCKITSRTFRKCGWAWLPRIHSFLPLHLSFRFLAKKNNGIILYQGPLNSNSFPDSEATISILSIYLENGVPVLYLKFQEQDFTLTASKNSSLVDGKWHALHININKEKMSMMVDLCSKKKTKGKFWDSSSCFSSLKFTPKLTNKRGNHLFIGGQTPLQIGALAHSYLNWKRNNFGSIKKKEDTCFEGCIAHLRVKGKLIDLGEPPYSSNSEKNCMYNGVEVCDNIKFYVSPLIKYNNNCTSCENFHKELITEENYEHSSCQCLLGLTKPPHCPLKSRPVTLKENSYASIALAFVPDPQRVSIEVKLKTKSLNGLIVKLWSRRAPLSLSLHISNGYLCLSFSTKSKSENPKTLETRSGSSYQLYNTNTNISKISTVYEDENFDYDDRHSQMDYIKHDLSKHSSSLCLRERPISDGQWHSAIALRLGHHLILQVDDGEDGNYNETAAFMDNHEVLAVQPLDFVVDVREGVSVGGVPQYVKRNLSLVEEDLQHACLDDLKIAGRRLPLPPLINNTDDGQVTTMQGIEKGCNFNGDVNCDNANCHSPLKCRNIQGQAVCGCRTGRVLTPSGCRRVDLCLFSPCLNGGSCKGNGKGFSCVCSQRFTGRYCQWKLQTEYSYSLNLMLAIGVAISVALLVLVLCSLCCARRKKQNSSRRKSEKEVPSGPKIKKVKDCQRASKTLAQKMKKVEDLSPEDDLRNYYYEDVEKGLHDLSLEESNLDPNFKEVIDLLTNLPDGIREKTTKTSKLNVILSTPEEEATQQSTSFSLARSNVNVNETKPSAIKVKETNIFKRKSTSPSISLNSLQDETTTNKKNKIKRTNESKMTSDSKMTGYLKRTNENKKTGETKRTNKSPPLHSKISDFSPGNSVSV